MLDYWKRDEMRRSFVSLISLWWGLASPDDSLSGVNCGRFGIIMIRQWIVRYD